jgi:hypothetical protein
MTTTLDIQHSFTLDTTCLIDIDEGRPGAAAIRKLADAHSLGKADVAVVAMSASEKQRGGRYIQNFIDVRDRLVSLGLAHLRIIEPMGYFDITFWDYCLRTDDLMIALERQIHEILFPNFEFSWHDYCRTNGIDPVPTFPSDTWRNRKCDVQAMWSHIHAKRDVFVTSDNNFHRAEKKAALIALGAKQIEYPDSAAGLLTCDQLANFPKSLGHTCAPLLA